MIVLADEQAAERTTLCGFENGLVEYITGTSNRIRGLLTLVLQVLERFLGSHLWYPAMPDLLERYPGPAVMLRAGKSRVAMQLRQHAPRKGRVWVEAMFRALGEQTMAVAGTNTAGIVLGQLSAQFAHLRTARADIFEQVEVLEETHPLHDLLTSTAAVCVRTTARIITGVIGKQFESARHLASYAGLTPVTWRSGISSRGDHTSRTGSEVLKLAVFGQDVFDAGVVA